MWINLDSQSSIDKLLGEFGGFHDACLREISITTETYVGEDLGMACPGDLDTSALFFFQAQNRSLSAIEIKCDRVTSIHLTPTPEGCDSIIMGGEITTNGKIYRMALNFIGGPLTGPPNSSIFIKNRSYEEPDIEITAEAIAWRAVYDGLGNRLRYRRPESV
jgi:hypothetical protein